MQKYLVGSLVLFFLVGCSSTLTGPTNNGQSQYNSQAAQSYQYNASQEDEYFDESYSFGDYDEKTSNDYELFFADSKGVTYYSKSVSSDPFAGSIGTLIDDVMKNATARMRDYTRSRKLKLVLKVIGEDEYRDSIIDAAETYIVSKPYYSLDAQDDVTRNIVAKILKKELDPFYQSGNVTDLAAKASDFILVISFDNQGDTLDFRASLLSKTSEMLGKAAKMFSFEEDGEAGKSTVRVNVPFANGLNTMSYEVYKNVVSEYDLKATGSKLKPADNVTYEQANNYCAQKHNGQPIDIFAFEYARRNTALIPPSGNAYLEMIVPYDEEDHEGLEKEGDRLEIDEHAIESDMMTVFDWRTETYSAASVALYKKGMTFRCMTLDF